MVRFIGLFPKCLPVTAIVFALTAAFFPCYSAYDSILKSQDVLYKNTILLDLDTTLDSCIFRGFSYALSAELIHSLASVHFNVRKMQREHIRLTKDDSSDIVLSVFSGQTTQQGQQILVSVCTFNRLNSPGANRDSALSPLVDMVIDKKDTASASIMLSQKIAENLRARYVCTVVIVTQPGGAVLTSSSGIFGLSPAVWPVPFGVIDIRAEKKGYIAQTIRINNQGNQNHDSVFIEFLPRKLWHSKYFYPAIGFTCASAVCYGFEYYYYNKYKKLGTADLQSNPGSFGGTFQSARKYEYAGSFFLGLSGVSFGMTFFW